MRHLRRIALILGMLSVAIPAIFIFVEFLAIYRYTIERSGEAPCGVPLYAMIFCGTVFSIIGALLAAILSYFSAQMNGNTGIAPKPEAILLAMGPVWLMVLIYLIDLFFSFLLPR